MIFAAVMVYMIERKFLKAARWTFAASALSIVGLIHAYRLTETGVQNHFGFSRGGSEFGIIYAIFGAILLMLHYRHKFDGKSSRRKIKKTIKVEPERPKSKVGYL